MSCEDGRKFVELIEKRERLLGTRVFRMLLQLATSHYAVNRNHKELSSAVSCYENNLAIWNINKRQQLDRFLREFSRLLQNYLLSIYSLIEHTRVFCKDLECPKLDDEYTHKLEILLNNDCVRFVRDLRTYSQHIGLPFISANISFSKRSKETDQAQIKHQILLEKNELEKWKRWNKQSRKYLDSQESIDLKIVLGVYQTLTHDFYQWFYKRVSELYSRELEEFFSTESEIAKLG
jgi:hypothetical protein